MSNQNASPAIQPNLPIDSLSLGKEQGRLYKNRNWLYQKYIVEQLSTPDIGKICNIHPSTIYVWLKKYRLETRSYSQSVKIARKKWKEKYIGTKIYHNKNWLYQKYWIEGLDSEQIAFIADTKSNTIMRWLRHNNIKIKPKGENQKGRKHLSKRAKKSISNKAKLRWKNPIYIKKMSKILKGTQAGKKNPNYGGKFTKLDWVRKKISKANKGRKIGEEEMKRRILSWKIRPTKLENIFNNMTNKNIRYIGDGSWWRKLNDDHYHNPDFKVTGQNKIIEIFGDYWHRNDNPQELIDLYNQAGLDCLIIHEKEFYPLNNSPTKRILTEKYKQEILKKVNNFINT